MPSRRTSVLLSKRLRACCVRCHGQGRFSSTHCDFIDLPMYWLDMNDRTLVMVMVNGIGKNLTNDEKRAHLADLRREHLIDQVCIQEILPDAAVNQIAILRGVASRQRINCPSLKQASASMVLENLCIPNVAAQRVRVYGEADLVGIFAHDFDGDQRLCCHGDLFPGISAVGEDSLNEREDAP
jgi:hypothetical protein